MKPKPIDPSQLRAAVELLESIVDDRATLAGIPEEDRKRLLQAAGKVSRPDAIDRRRLLKASNRKRKAEKVQREEDTFAATGIRKLRSAPVFNTPNAFAPENFEQQEVEGDPDFRETVEPQHCYVCKKFYTQVHHFYDQLCPECAEFNYFKRTELADLSGRVALLTGGRVKIGYQAGIKLLRSGARLRDAPRR